MSTLHKNCYGFIAGVSVECDLCDPMLVKRGRGDIITILKKKYVGMILYH